MRYFVALAGALVLNATANLMMKFGIERFKAASANLAEGIWPALAALMTNWVLILGLVCFAANLVLYTYALKELPISIAYPIMVTVDLKLRYLAESIQMGNLVFPAVLVFILFDDPFRCPDNRG